MAGPAAPARKRLCHPVVSINFRSIKPPGTSSSPSARHSFALVLLAALALPAAPAADAQPRAPEVFRLGGGAWSWFGDPRAVQHRGRLYAGWIDRSGDVRVTMYDPASGRKRTRLLKRRLGADDHNNPSLVVRPDGRLMAFFSPHSGRFLPPPGIPSRLYYRVARRPAEMLSFNPLRRLLSNSPGPLGYTYPNAVTLPAERRIFLFWRGGNWLPTFSTSRDGRRWSRARTLIQAPLYSRPYVKYATNGRDAIELAFTEAHPGSYPTSIYYARYRRGRLVRADGRRIGPLSRAPFAPAQADKVYDGRRARAWVHDVAVDRHGRPAIVYVTYRSPRRLLYRYARWTGRRWRNTTIVPAGAPVAGSYAGGISLDHEAPEVVYLARRRGRFFEIERWQTDDGGSTWRSSAVTSRSRTDNIRPVAPRGLRGAEMVLWMRGRYRGYTRYRTAIVGARLPDR